ncbi:aminoglycoside phosphotransferase family protein [Actinosynnema sp. CS-041913]|uniref:aminoglycoside phosphotransferase family protein n=1 Tax=Actinosynnema sp. CS-041913 TaxID=3239917 RepID=UPI003D92F9FE
MGERKIVIDGGRVSRPAGWWSPTVHALLEHLHGVGFDRVPKPLGLSGGREVLTHIPGDSGPAGWARVAEPQGLRAFARLLRDFHEASRGFVVDDAVWALPSNGISGVTSEVASGVISEVASGVICHGDFGPWNVVWDGLVPVGLLDFDFARPGDPLDDVAYALEYVAPFRDDGEAVRWHGFATPPDRRARIEVFARAYGLPDTTGLVDAVIRRQEQTIRDVELLARRGVEPQRTWVRDGVVDVLGGRVEWSRRNRGLVG